MTALPPLYLITDRQLFADEKTFFTVLEELLRAGVAMLQLREKDLSAAELLPLAQQIRELTQSYACRFLVNDRIDVAQAVDADGVQLGGHSLPASTVRKLLGPDKLIGVSTHNLDELANANQQGADFATFGPVFFTPSKAAYGEPVGLATLRQAVTSSEIPVYGLGGIKQENAVAVKQTGAHGVALISALLNSETPTKSCQNLLKILSN